MFNINTIGKSRYAYSSSFLWYFYIFQSFTIKKSVFINYVYLLAELI